MKKPRFGLPMLAGDRLLFLLEKYDELSFDELMQRGEYPNKSLLMTALQNRTNKIMYNDERKTYRLVKGVTIVEAN